MGGWWGGWRDHGVGGGGVSGCRVHWVGGCGGVGGGDVHGGVGGWRVHGVGAYTHPPMNSYNVKTFHFMNTHPPIKHIQSVTLSLLIYFGWLMGWVVVGLLEGSWGGCVGSGMGSWRVHEWVVVGWVVGGFMG